MPDIVVIHSSVANQNDASRLADALIGERLAACVQITQGATAVYRWQGSTEHGTEWLLSIKTTTAACPRVVAWLEKNHPYETPEIIWSVYHATAAYADWASDAVA